MDLNEGMEQLSKLFKGKDWFYDVGTDSFGRYVVYINFACHETLHDIPDYVGGRQVVVHFVGSKFATKDKYVNDGNTRSKLIPYSKEIDVSAVILADEPTMDEVVGSDEEEKSLPHLQKELDRLEKACGSYTLQDIFYEVQDGKNAVTNNSARYPEVRKSMEKLYDQYGFDVIYEELDG